MKAYVFRQDAGAWSQEWVFAGPDSRYTAFGRVVELNGETAFIGDPTRYTPQLNAGSGAVFVYDRLPTSAWVETQILVPSDPFLGDQFGSSFAVDGDVAIIGAPGDNDGQIRDVGAVSGSAHAVPRALRKHGLHVGGQVAQGGMGVIHQVYDQDVRRHLAMKVILGEGGTQKTGETPDVDSRSLGRLLEEAQVTGQLDHPGIVPVHELGVHASDRVHFTVKLVKGEDLRSVFDRVHDSNDEGWNQTRALSVLLRVCEARAYAHSKGVIHRDLKPSNIMVGKYGETYVMDWGLARVLGTKDQKDLRVQSLPMQPPTPVDSHRKDASDDSPNSPMITMDGDVEGAQSLIH